MNLFNFAYHRLVQQISLPGKGFLDKYMSKWKTKDLKVNYRVSQMIPEKGKNIGDEKFFAGTHSHTVTGGGVKTIVDFFRFL